MGYSLQRFSPLTQINKDTVKRLVPVWNYSFDDNKSEQSQPIVYKGVIYVTTGTATMAVDRMNQSRPRPPVQIAIHLYSCEAKKQAFAGYSPLPPPSCLSLANTASTSRSSVFLVGAAARPGGTP